MHVLYTALRAARFQNVFETIGRQPESERRNRAGCEKHNGSAKTKAQPRV
jgi:hypothetical protein